MVKDCEREMSELSENLTRVKFNIDSSLWHRSSSETLWVERCTKGLRRINNIPFLVFGVSFDDLIETEIDQDGLESFVSVSKKGGHSTYRMIVQQDIVPEATLQPLSNLGCSYEVGRIGQVLLVALSVPPQAKIQDVYAQLEAGEADGVWDFEESNFEHLA